MTYTKHLLAMAAFLVSTAATAEPIALGDLTIDKPHSFSTTEGTKSGAGYMMITNTGSEDELLVSASSPLGMTELHKSETDANGVARMIEQEDGIPIPAGETVMLEPGGLHVMFMGLTAPLEEGEQHEVKLVFQNAGEIDLTFDIMDRGAAAAHNH
ncbi:MAG: copper chaperone PCu(A)C [Pseudomonadota bacterium]